MKRSWVIKRFRRAPAPVRRIMTWERLGEDLREVVAAVNRAPCNYSARSHLVELLRETGRKREALAMWRETTRRFPGQSAPYFQRATWAMKSGDFAEAEKYLRLALRYDHGYFRETALFWRAEANRRLGRFQAAESHLKRVKGEMYYLPSEAKLRSELLDQIRTKQSHDA